MKRLFVLMLLLLLVLGTTLTAYGIGEDLLDDLTGSAGYMWADSIAYFSFRTDDEIINEIDSLIERVLSHFPEDALPTEDTSLRSLLNEALSESGMGIDFDNDVRSWLGDTIAVGVGFEAVQRSGDAPFLIAIDITDRAQATVFVEQIFENSPDSSPAERLDTPTYTLFTPEDPDEEGAIAVLDDVILFGLSEEDMPLEGELSSSLAANATFIAAVSELPENSYDALLFADVGAIVQNAAPPELAMMDMPSAVVGGFGIFDGRSLLADIAILPGEGGELPTAGMINPDFASHIPLDASFVLHSADLNATYTSLLETLRNTMAQQGTNPEAFDLQISQVETMIATVLGMDLHEDVLSWMTGDYAAFVTIDGEAIIGLLDSSGSPQLDSLPMGLGIVIEATDHEAASNFATAISTAAHLMLRQNTEITVSEEQIGGADVLVLSAEIPLDSETSIPLDVLFGANDEVAVIGTRDAVTAILTGAPGLDSTAIYTNASNYFLEKPSAVLYMDQYGIAVPTVVVLALLGPAIGNIFDNIVDELESSALPSTAHAYRPLRAQQDDIGETIESALGMLESMSFTTATTGSGSVLVRFVFTLG